LAKLCAADLQIIEKKKEFFPIGKVDGGIIGNAPKRIAFAVIINNRKITHADDLF
jgi:hypothetical protein